MAYETYEIRSIDELVEVGVTLPTHWFRGHSEIYGTLTPGVYRPEYQFSGGKDCELNSSAAVLDRPTHASQG
jgi:hypothetical protein